MTKTSFTQEEFFQAINDLTTQNEQLTTCNIRRKLGGRGSYSTIGEMLEKYRSSQCEAMVSELSSLPADINNTLSSTIKNLYTQACENIMKRYNDLMSAKDKALQDVTLELKEVYAKVDTLELALSNEKEKYRNLEEMKNKELQEIHQQLGKSNGQSDILKLQISELNHQLSELLKMLGEAVSKKK